MSRPVDRREVTIVTSTFRLFQMYMINIVERTVISATVDWTGTSGVWQVATSTITADHSWYSRTFFTARCYAMRGRCLSVRLPSDTAGIYRNGWTNQQTFHRPVATVPHHSSFWSTKRYGIIPTGTPPPNEGVECTGV